VAITLTVALPDTPPVAVAVTVIAVPDAKPFADNVPVTIPLASVAVADWVMVPLLVAKVTVTLLMVALLAFLTTAVIVAVAEPSPGIDATELVTFTDAAVAPPPPVVPVVLLKSLVPPQATSTNAIKPRPIDAILRMFLSHLTQYRRGSPTVFSTR
jgi:hypothetical protein